jgi:hypothetical protein
MQPPYISNEPTKWLNFLANKKMKFNKTGMLYWFLPENKTNTPLSVMIDGTPVKYGVYLGGDKCILEIGSTKYVIIGMDSPENTPPVLSVFEEGDSHGQTLLFEVQRSKPD